MPPQNARFAYAAYAVATILYTAYAVSIWSRARTMARRLRRRHGTARPGQPS